MALWGEEEAASRHQCVWTKSQISHHHAPETLAALHQELNHDSEDRVIDQPLEPGRELFENKLDEIPNFGLQPHDHRSNPRHSALVWRNGKKLYVSITKYEWQGAIREGQTSWKNARSASYGLLWVPSRQVRSGFRGQMQLRFARLLIILILCSI